MISKIYAHNFKGLNFEQELGQRTLFVGPNGAGKSARSQALTLAILGYLPSDGNKQPSAIFATHGTGEEMTVAFEVDGQRFSRRYRQGKDGNVTQELSLNGKKLSQKEIARALIDLGDPRIFDLHSFNDLSDTKKIDYLFSLFPPSGDLRQIETQLEKLKDKENQIKADIRAAGQVVERLTNERNQIFLPSGTLPGIQAQIMDAQENLKVAEYDLRQLEIAEAKRIAEEEARDREEKARQKAEEKAAKAEAERDKRQWEAKESRRKEVEALDLASEAQSKEAKAFERACIAEAELQAERQKNQEAMEMRRGEIAQPGASPCMESLQRILDAMKQTGCDLCSAMIIVKQEMGKFK